MRDNLNDLDRVGVNSIVISDALNKLCSILARNKDLPCVIYGETGTGKEEFAKLVHQRRTQLEGKIPFVAVNCAHLNSDLAISTLFGHVRGSFSGADRNTSGLIEEADGGILFLDEVHALSLETQQRLLRVLNDGSYTKLGDTKIVYSRFQVLTASVKDLDDLVDAGSFLLDFRSRLTGIDIRLPALRERAQDIPELIRIFLAQKSISMDQPMFDSLVAKCGAFYWQGNIRQLFYVLNAWYALCDGNLDVDRLPSNRTMHPPHRESNAPGCMSRQLADMLDVVERAISLDVSLTSALESVEKYILKNALELHPHIRNVYEGWSISRNNLYFKRRRYGLTELAPQFAFEAA